MALVSSSHGRASPRPRISIGLPVYNGERYLREAIGSLLSQTYADFELIISDNVSDDRTEDICREFVERDERVRYQRQTSNVGAAGNFNSTFRSATGEFFKWAAHDDVCEPTFLERCVETLEDDPGAVIAYPDTQIIDADSQPIEIYDKKLRTDSDDPVTRFADLLLGHKCFEVFGLIRRTALSKTGLIAPYAHGDGILLVQLALQGRFACVPAPLFHARKHDEQSMTMIEDYTSFAAWFDPKRRGALPLPYWKIYLEWWKSVRRSPLDATQRRRCYKVLYWSAKSRRKILWNEAAALPRLILASLVRGPRTDSTDSS